MKVKNIILYSITVICLILNSCSKDNYSAPNAGIKGSITNALTGEPFQTEQPNGVKIRMLEEKYKDNVQPIDFWSRRDGSFENANIFEGKYKVIPIEGAFFSTDTISIDVQGVVEVNFKVTPFLTIAVMASGSSGEITTSYKISRDRIGDKITECKTIVSSYPAVSNTINEFNATRDLSAQTDSDILSTDFSDTITGLTSGNTYYIRIAAKTANADNRYNYSDILEVKVP